MPGSTIIAIPDWIDGADLVASTTQSTFAVENLKTMSPGDRWQADVLTDPMVITATRASAYPLTFAGIYVTNASERCTRRFAFDWAGNTVFDTDPFGPMHIYDHAGAMVTGSSADPAFDVTGAFCIEMPMRIDENRFQGIVAFDDAGFVTLAVRQSPVRTIEVYDSDWGNKVLESQTVPTEGVPFHLAVAFDGATLRLVINGATEDSAAWAIPGAGANLGGTLLCPVVEEIAGDRTLIGGIQELRFWNANRTDAQIELYRHLPLQPAYDANLAVYFKLLEGAGVSATDEIGAVAWTLAGADDSLRYWGYLNRVRARSGMSGWSSYGSSLYIPYGINADEMRTSILDANNADGFFRAGRLYAGNGWKVEQGGKQFGWGVGTNDRSPRGELAAGQLTVQRRAPTPRKTARFAVIGTNEAEMLTNVFRILMQRAGRDVVAVFDLDTTPELQEEKTIYGLMQERNQFVYPNRGTYVHEFQIEGLT